jgi:negative regulator of sigma E activity
MSGSSMDDRGDEAFVRRIKTALDEGNEHLEARVRSRLRQARHAALAQVQPRPAFWARQWVPAVGVAAAAVLAILVWPHAPSVQPPDEALNDLEIVLAGENLDLLENLDFYEWVDAESSI